MGWTFFADNPAETRESIIRREFETTASGEHAYSWGFDSMAVRGSTVYAIMWREHSTTKNRVYFGTVILTQRKRGQFGYKDMSEDCGPYYYDAPVGMIKRLNLLAPVDPGSNAAGWRVRCLQHADERKAKRREVRSFKPGDRVKFSPNGQIFELLEKLGPRRGFLVRVAGRPDCSKYTASARQMSKAQLFNQEV